MKKVQEGNGYNGEWWLPDTEINFVKSLEKHGPYQQRQRTVALEHVTNWNIALDIGANVGFWTKPLCDKFNKVYAWEPHLPAIECWKENIKNENAILEECALGNKQEELKLYYSSKQCGGTSFHLGEHLKHHVVQVKTLDDYEFEKNSVGFVKMDIQEHEIFALQGANKFLDEQNPVLCIEAPARDQREMNLFEQIKTLLDTKNYELVRTTGKERIFIRQ